MKKIVLLAAACENPTDSSFCYEFKSARSKKYGI
ncbi:hypothetical protein HNP76_001811 [Treponema ruminis]|uniref:Uncharacterized protein n=1 Tax=Treponema ruminis TaxID=744515 RepID=A0A7W8G9N8_9SPIR|nr:hypothetical protein [Treponema ruminis]